MTSRSLKVGENEALGKVRAGHLTLCHSTVGCLTARNDGRDKRMSLAEIVSEAEGRQDWSCF